MRKILLIGLLTLFISNANSQFTFHSFLDSINKISLAADKIILIDSFFNQMNAVGIPFIEGDTANFIYYGDVVSVNVAGDFNGWGSGGLWLCNKIPETNFFYYSRVFEQTARLDYKFILNAGNWILDPHNPNQVSGGFGPNSELAMPGYVQPWEIEIYDGVEQGTIESFSLASPEVGKSFNIQIYMPPGYEDANDFAYSTVYVHDGHEYISLGSMTNVLNNLLDSNKIDPLIAVFIKPNDRTDEYAGANRFNYAQYVSETVVPYIDANYKTYPHKESRLTMGASFGGNTSGLIAHTYPKVFANSGWHSPALWPNDGEVALLYITDKKDVKIYFNVGTYENLGIDWPSFTDELTSLGYEFEWKQFYEGHSWGQWRATIDDILQYFFPPGFTPVNVEKSNAEKFSIGKIYPNPSSSIAFLPFTISTPGEYNLNVYNQLGQLIINDSYSYNTAGERSIEIETSQLYEGIYYYVLRNSKESLSGKIVVKW